MLAALPVLERTGSDVDVVDVVHDSRDAKAGVAFGCIVGSQTDGHLHAPEAVERGAVALLVERLLELPVPQARVADVRSVLGPAAAALHGRPSSRLQCLGVTGTNGKTTTTYLLEAIARAAGASVAVIGTTGVRVDGSMQPSEHTTPEADDLQRLLDRLATAGVQTVAMEVSSHALAQHRIDGTTFAATCFTNLTHEHLDYHGDLESYFAAKLGLYVPERTPTVATNVGDAFGARVVPIARERGLDVWTYAVVDDHTAADVTARGVTIDGQGTCFVLADQRGGHAAEITLDLIGAHNVANALAAATTMLAAGTGFDHVVAGLHVSLVVPGRAESIRQGQPFTAIVDYAHTPDALERILEAARAVAGSGRVLVVFGCGGDRDREKRPLMGRAAARGASLAIVTSDNPRSEDPAAIVDAIVAGTAGVPDADVVVELDRRSAIRHALEAAAADDVVVIAGKGHETGQTTAGRTVPFDDRVVVSEELRELGWS